MIDPGAFALVLVAIFATEAIYLWFVGLRRSRAEEAYWRARDNRPPLYDWAKELDL